MSFVNEVEIVEPGGVYLCQVDTHPLSLGAHFIDLIRLPQGVRILRCDLVLDVAAVNSGGTTLLTVRTDESTPTVYLGTGAGYDLATTAPAFVLMDTPTSGGDAASKLRPKMTDNHRLQAVVSNVTAVATSAAQFTVAVIASREKPASGP